MKIRIPAAVAAIAAFATFACQQDLDRDVLAQRADLPTSQIRDSAGILITENARPADGSRLGWRIGPEPTLTIGAVEGEEPYLFHMVRSAFRLPDGRIVVPDLGTDEMRVFTATGNHLMSWGGKGPGPGEFSALFGAGPWPGDSIVAWYSGKEGISFFDANGRHARSIFLRGNHPEQSWANPRPVAVRQDGTILSVMGEEVLGSIIVDVWDGDGGLHASLGHYRNSEMITMRDVDGETETVEPAYSRKLVTTTWGDLIVATWNKPYEIRALHADGTLARIVRLEHVPIVPTEADRHLFLEERKASFGTFVNSSGQLMSAAQVEEWIMPSLESLPLAEHFPAFSTVLADDTGHLWVREYDLPLEENPAPLWTVFDPEGRVLGFVETPAGFDILQIGEDFILGRVKDEFEVEYVQLLPLER